MGNTLCVEQNKSVASYWPETWPEEMRGGWFVVNHVGGILGGCLLFRYWQCNSHSLALEWKLGIFWVRSSLCTKNPYRFLWELILLKPVSYLMTFPRLPPFP